MAGGIKKSVGAVKQALLKTFGGGRHAQSGELNELMGRVDSGNLTDHDVATLSILSRVPDKKEREFIEVNHKIPLNKFGDYSSYLETGHKKVWVTYRACRILSSYLVSAGFKIMREQGPTQEDIDVTKAVGGFLSKPNEYDSWEDMIEMWTFHMELTGNAYWLKDQPDLFGRPAAIYPLLPQHMRVVTGTTNKYEKYVYRVQGKEIEFDPKDIIHFRRAHPNSLFFGMGSIEPSEELYNKFIDSDTLESKFNENGAQVSGILVKEDATESQTEWEAFKDRFNLEYSGRNKAGKTAFMNGKWSYHKLGMTKSEMQTLESSKWTVEQICMNHGVPLSIFGFQKAANRATARQDDLNLRKLTVVPLLDILVATINGDGFFRGQDENLKLMYALEGLVDIEQIQKDWLPVLAQGAITRNELREKLNMSKVPNPLMDQFLIPAGLIPIELAGFGSTADDEGDTITRRAALPSPQADPPDEDEDPDADTE